MADASVVGLACVNGAMLAGAGRIVAADTQPGKLELARLMGATDTLLAGNEDVVKTVKKMTGVQHSFERGD